MARRLASRWLEAQATPEYRIKVLNCGPSRDRGARLPNLLRGFRDSKVKLGNLDAIPDLGIEDGLDYFVVWSSDHEALMKLGQWLEGKGYETSGIW